MPDNQNPKPRTTDERLDGLTQTVEILAAMMTDIAVNQQRDGENIRALARIAELHHERLTHLEGDQP